MIDPTRRKQLVALARKFAKSGIDDRNARRTAEVVLQILRDAIMESAPEISIVRADIIANQMVFTASLYIAANKNM